MIGKGIGEQLAAFYPLADVFEHGAQVLVLLALDQQIERIQDGQAGLDQREELLVVDEEGALLELAATAQGKAAGKQPLGLDPVDEIALRGEAVAHLRDGVPLLHLLVGMTPIVSDFYYEFRHATVCFGFLTGTLSCALSLTFRLAILDAGSAKVLSFQYRK